MSTKGVKDMPEKKVIDIHIHIGGTGDTGSGCRMSHEFIFSFAFAAMLITLKVTPFELGDEKMKEVILNAVNASTKIDCAVLLALDGVYKNGRYVESESHLVTPNDYIIQIAKDNPRVLFGASVHPYRKKKEMLAETKRCVDHGAVLFKWIPSSQQIDPRDDRCLPFYEILAKEEDPKLCYAHLSKTLKTYVGNKLHLTGEVKTSDELKEAIQQRITEGYLVGKTATLLQELERRRFAPPISGAETPRNLVQETLCLIEKMEKVL